MARPFSPIIQLPFTLFNLIARRFPAIFDVIPRGPQKIVDPKKVTQPVGKQ
jgi:hypothetical protein